MLIVNFYLVSQLCTYFPYITFFLKKIHKSCFKQLIAMDPLENLADPPLVTQKLSTNI